MLDSTYHQRTHDLAVGFEPRDELTGGRPSIPVRLDMEFPDGVPRRVTKGYAHNARPGDLIPGISRHHSGLYKLIFLDGAALPADAIVRIYDDWQYFIPRRLRFPIPARDDVWLEQRPRASRRQVPLMLPASAYPVAERAMGLRGRVLRGGDPMPWSWIEATCLIPNEEAGVDPAFFPRGIIGRAISDANGEFLLVLRPLPQVGFGVPDLQNPVWVEVVVAGPTPAPVEPAGNEDPLWSVPEEQFVAGADPAMDPTYLPPNYQRDTSATGSRIVPFQPGKLLTGIDVPDFQFSLP